MGRGTWLGRGHTAHASRPWFQWDALVTIRMGRGTWLGRGHTAHASRPWFQWDALVTIRMGRGTWLGRGHTAHASRPWFQWDALVTIRMGRGTWLGRGHTAHASRACLARHQQTKAQACSLCEGCTPQSCRTPCVAQPAAQNKHRLDERAHNPTSERLHVFFVSLISSSLARARTVLIK
jgi:hypothetical protein